MREIGLVVQVQVQRSWLKVRDGTRRVYDPAPLLVVSHLHLETGGVVGFTDDGGEIIDVHHVAHPISRNRGGLNGVSIGFTAHYEAMRARFGDHLSNGCAGENILVETRRSQSLADLGSRLVFCADRDSTQVTLEAVQVAPPCVEFSHFVSGQQEMTPEQVRETLRFLHNGQRGFYASLTGSQRGTVAAGDRLDSTLWNSESSADNADCADSLNCLSG
jgi:hypothetical protein